MTASAWIGAVLAASLIVVLGQKLWAQADSQPAHSPATPTGKPTGKPPVWAGKQYQVFPEAAASVPVGEGIVRIARWRGDRKAAVTFIFDDGTPDQFDKALPILDQLHLHATIAVNPGRMKVSWPQWQLAVANGHELANHGMAHKGLVQWKDEGPDAPGLREEVLDSKVIIEQNTGKPCVTWVAPGNVYGPFKDMVAQHYLALRLGDGGLPYGAKGVGGSTPPTVAMYNQRLKDLVQSGQWKLSMVHAVATGFDPMGEKELREHLEFASSLADDLWIETAGVIARYDLEARNATLKIQPQAASISVLLESPLDPELFNEPLTLVVTTAGTVSKARATRDGKELPVTIRSDSLLVEAVADKSPILINWQP